MKSDGSESVSGDHELVPAEPDKLDLESTKNFKPVGQYSTMVSMVASGPHCPGFNSQCSQKIMRKNVNVAEVNQRRCLEESGQCLENC